MSSVSNYDHELFMRIHRLLQTNSLFNKDLQQICRSEGLSVGGVKAALQLRITGRASSTCSRFPDMLLTEHRARPKRSS